MIHRKSNEITPTTIPLSSGVECGMVLPRTKLPRSFDRSRLRPVDFLRRIIQQAPKVAPGRVIAVGIQRRSLSFWVASRLHGPPVVDGEPWFWRMEVWGQLAVVLFLTCPKNGTAPARLSCCLPFWDCPRFRHWMSQHIHPRSGSGHLIGVGLCT
ncbi:hypothetical protein ASPTUDRAFT_43661 [Aspergillus tubingensis CBS 134.48]|uniref:Uncharacterized protein n=1 Tax=Aspergillus tubingensis (strain CBS 134.48) TaxID=767770 RepID=A0A1L9N5Y6_ASPTC|nr:hypothetical protein ASPTUDRAFT_43661 [Aspergillus tubingensis CBS 134.48]